MNEDMKNLLALQDADLRVIDLELSKEAFPRKVAELEGAINSIMEAIADTERKVAEAKVERKNVGEEITQAKTALDKSEERLNSITTNREYDAVHAEIEAQKHTVATGDKRLDASAGQLEEFDEALKLAQEELTRVREENQPQVDDLKEKIANIDSNVAQVLSERELVVPKIQKHFVRSYDHIRKTRKNGQVLSIVSNADRTCSICFQVLDPRVVTDTRQGIELTFCQNCGSILVWEDVQAASAEGSPKVEAPVDEMPPEETPVDGVVEEETPKEES